MDRRVALAFARFDAAELKFCRYLNLSSRSSAVRQLFRAASWLGDGWLWYGLMLALPFVYGLNGLQASLHLVATGALGAGNAIATLNGVITRPTSPPAPCSAGR